MNRHRTNRIEPNRTETTLYIGAQGSGWEPSSRGCFLKRPPRASQEGSKSVQERSKSPPRGFPWGSASRMRFGSRFGRWVRVASWARFWALLASLSGAFWPPRWLKHVLEIVLDRPRAVQEHFFAASEASKSATRGLQEQFKRHPGAEKAPRWVQEASGDRF